MIKAPTINLLKENSNLSKSGAMEHDPLKKRKRKI